MKLVMTLVVRDEADVVDAQIAYHLNAGVDFVVAADHESRDGSTDVLESYSRDGFLRRMPVQGARRDPVWRTDLARLAVKEYGANWVLDSETDEFWLPRAESIKDVLLAIPPRYGVVQALVRVFLPRPDDDRPFATRMTVRRTLADIRDDETSGRLDWALRPLYRAAPDMVVGAGREQALEGRVPLRAWYPIEVLRFPVRTLEQAERRAVGRAGPGDVRSRIEREVLDAHARGDLPERWSELVVGDDALAQGLADESLVVDERLRDVLDRLAENASAEDGPRFARPTDGAAQLGLRAPSVVEDVAYAGECAAIREVDFEPLVGRIAELEERITSLEARFWPRVRRKLTRLVRR